MKMNGKTVLITGSTDGVGRYVAAKLAAAGAKVLIHGRDKERAQSLIAEISGQGHGEPIFYQADLSSLDGARALADAVLAGHKRLDVFISNAGIGSRTQGAERRTSADGHALRFAVNYLSGFLLAYKLLPLLKASGARRDPRRPRKFFPFLGNFPRGFSPQKKLLAVAEGERAVAYRQRRLA